MNPKHYKIFIILIFLPVLLLSQTELKYTNSTLWTFNSDVLVEGTTLFTSLVNGLQIWDITDKLNPVQLSQIYFKTGAGGGLAKEGNLLFMAHNAGGVKIIDVTDPAAPQLIREITGIGNVADVQIVNDTLYTVSDRADFRIYDVSNINSPFLLTTRNLDGITSDIKVRDNFLYIPYQSQTPGCYVVDVSNKFSALVVDTVLSSASWYEVFIKDNLMFASQDTAGMGIYDISNPRAIQTKGRYNTLTRCMAVTAAGDYAYLSNFTEGLIIINVSNPDSPVYTGQDPFQIYSYGRLTYSGNFIFQLQWDPYNAGCQFKDVSNPDHPDYIGRTPAYDYLRHVKVDNNYAYVCAGHQGTFVVDLSNPDHLTVVSQIRWINNWMTDIKDGYAYLASTDAGVKVADVSNPAAPFTTDSLDIPGAPRALMVRDNYLYVAAWENFYVLDVSNKYDISVVDNLGNLGECIGIDVSGNYAYLASRDSGLFIIDITDPANISRAGRYSLEGFAQTAKGQDVVIHGTYAYFAVIDHAIHILDISNPVVPVLLKTYPASAEDLYKNGNFLAVARSGLGVEIIDISKPEDILRLSLYDTPGTAKSVFLQNVSQDSFKVMIADNSSMILLEGNLVTSIASGAAGIVPGKFSVSQNYPNPFNPRTTIEFILYRNSEVKLEVFDLTGRRVKVLAAQKMPASHYSYSWDGTNGAGNPVASGIYYYKVTVDNESITKKMVLLR